MEFTTMTGGHVARVPSAIGVAVVEVGVGSKLNAVLVLSKPMETPRRGKNLICMFMRERDVYLRAGPSLSGAVNVCLD